MPHYRNTPCICLHCGNEFLAERHVAKSGNAKYCSPDCGHAARTARAYASFWDKLDRSGDCWEWQGTCYPNGYGKAGLDSLGVQSSHRAAWILANGPIPKGMHVCHSCDNRKCCNPAHLFLGTHDDNMDDMVRKERSVAGERNYHAKLTESDVIAIRLRAKEGDVTNTALGKIYGVSGSVIGNVVNRKAWKHVP